MPIKTSDREYRNMSVMEARNLDVDGKKTVEGYATTFDQEYLLWDDGEYAVMESIDRHAFDQTDMADVIMQYDHMGRVIARTKNDTLQLDPDDHGLRVIANLAGTELGRQLYKEIEGGYTDRMSFGFTVATEERTEERDNVNNKTIIHRKITGIKKLYDVSAVSLPANDATEISARSCGEGVIDAARQEVAAAIERRRRIQRIRILMEVSAHENH